MYRIAIKGTSSVFMKDGDAMPGNFSDYKIIISAMTPVDLANKWLCLDGASVKMTINGTVCDESHVIPSYVESNISSITLCGLGIKTVSGGTPEMKLPF